MEELEWISADAICTYYHVDLSLIRTMGEYGLIGVHTEAENLMVPASDLSELERIVRWHRELDINLEGIQAIAHILQRVKDLQREVGSLRYRLRSYEGGVE